MNETKGIYTAGQLAELAGVSTRALRHYEDMGLLAPERAANGYRLYGPSDVRRLGHVLAMRACGLPLSTIGSLLKDPQADVRHVLCDHLASLQVQGKQLKEAMEHTEAAIAAIERMDAMDDTARFEQMKE
ncbi:MAG: MerR family transcriptional regulator [Eggerthellaceae bacterium]|nr:MerR family transcriptional regulator [Eggerthellaceae bacterium]